MANRPSFTIGIEEEYLIVDQTTFDLVRSPDPGFMAECVELTDGRATNEYMQCQVEVGTRPTVSIAEAAADLRQLRDAIGRAAGSYGYAPIAASTHPFSKWREQTRTPKERYAALTSDLGQNARRLLICGMHNHVEIEDPDLRIDLMNQLAYFLPHLLALTCSSPFWEGEDTDLSSYRLTVFDALPRTGLPDRLTSYTAYSRLTGQLINSGCIEDATRIWWDIRPSEKFPTLEQRITDVCSALPDAIAVAALFQCLTCFLFRLRSLNQRWRDYPATLIKENRWLAQRHGVNGKLIDQGKGELVGFADLAMELVSLTAEDAVKLGSVEQIARIEKIISNGTSCDKQRKTYLGALSQGATQTEALKSVTAGLVEEFRA